MILKSGGEGAKLENGPKYKMIMHAKQCQTFKSNNQAIMALFFGQ